MQMSEIQRDPLELERLTELFRKHGAGDPQAWARSQLQEGIPQLSIFCLLKAMWEGVVSDTDSSWIEREIDWSERYPNDPCASIGPALREMVTKGVRNEVISDLVRIMQYHLLYHVCCLLDGAQVPDLPVNNWAVFQLDDHGSPIAMNRGLHEVLLSMDPSRREMRPKGAAEG
jgi:hypothetical protein